MKRFNSKIGKIGSRILKMPQIATFTTSKYQNRPLSRHFSTENTPKTEELRENDPIGQNQMDMETLDKLRKIKYTFDESREGPFGTHVIQAFSSNFDGKAPAKITINDKVIKPVKNENGNFRGMHIVAVDPQDGKIYENHVFDTYESSDTMEKWIKKNYIRLDWIVIAACEDECAKNLSNYVKRWFGFMGSKEIWKVGYREGFTFIGTHGANAYKRNPPVEKRTINGQNQCSVT